jgi:NTE family protein
MRSISQTIRYKLLQFLASMKGAAKPVSSTGAARPAPTAGVAAAALPATNRKRIDLALQGGGAHGAFTWGVLDALLEDGRLHFDCISGTSAGAMNAIVLADGLHRGGTDGARERLEAFWKGVSREGGPATAAGDILDRILGFWRIPGFEPLAAFQQFVTAVSPYRLNPLNINPLKELLEQLVDFDSVRACQHVRLFISATNVRDGKIKIFHNEELSADALMASACLPYLFQAVEIEGEAYWDGGYAGNPALFPFFEGGGSEDILLVQISPVRRDEVPTSANHIMERVSEITFNAALLREFRAIDFVNRLMDEHRLDTSRYRRNRLHRIDANAALVGRNGASKLDTSWRFFQELKEAGRNAAKTWLEEHFEDVGRQATLDLRKEFL